MFDLQNKHSKKASSLMIELDQLEKSLLLTLTLNSAKLIDENYKIGDALCAAPNGTADIMTREEITLYPDRIIGIVDEIPDYEIWEQTLTHEGNGAKNTNHVQVKGRIWMYVR